MNIIVRENDVDGKVLLSEWAFENELKESLTEDNDVFSMYEEYLENHPNYSLTFEEYLDECFEEFLSKIKEGRSLKIMGEIYTLADKNIMKELISLIEKNISKLDSSEAFYDNEYPDFYEALLSLLYKTQMKLCEGLTIVETGHLEIDSDGYPRIAGRVSIKGINYSLYMLAIHHNTWEYYLK